MTNTEQDYTSQKVDWGAAILSFSIEWVKFLNGQGIEKQTGKTQVARYLCKLACELGLGRDDFDIIHDSIQKEKEDPVQ